MVNTAFLSLPAAPVVAVLDVAEAPAALLSACLLPQAVNAKVDATTTLNNE